MIIQRFRKMADSFRREIEAQKSESSGEAAASDDRAALYTPRGNFEWQILHAPPRQVYGDVADPGVVNLLRFPPKFALEIGCNTGILGHLIKQQFPQARVWGVEPNDVTAAIASTRLDHVLNSTLEDVDWASEGVQHGQIDTVFLFDVLEHIYDPWATLLALRNLISPEAQLVISVPNVRNVFLIQDLIHGHWRYREMGLLDITHIRFFTDQDLMRMFYQTGFRLMARSATFCERSQSLYQHFAGKAFPQVVELDGASIAVKSEQDLLSLCAMQHIVNLAPAEYGQLSQEERRWIDAPHPETYAYAGARP
jgi:2-polyprenyl-3-methyl-5-hydroxy-6-metoxy-1,4-benzoquinol methylase